MAMQNEDDQLFSHTLCIEDLHTISEGINKCNSNMHKIHSLYIL